MDESFPVAIVNDLSRMIDDASVGEIMGVINLILYEGIKDCVFYERSEYGEAMRARSE